MLPSVYNYQNEINKVLYLQAIVPVITGSLTVMGVVFILLFSINISGLLTLFMLPFSWVCVVNPLIAIFMVRTYRKAVIHPRKYLWAKPA
uniref:Uncharacterized protein n=1 Tax=Acrobeloides nanus TaxID=290746 RepID=A0A914CMJ2_9BILA